MIFVGHEKALPARFVLLQCEVDKDRKVELAVHPDTGNHHFALTNGQRVFQFVVSEDLAAALSSIIGHAAIASWDGRQNFGDNDNG